MLRFIRRRIIPILLLVALVCVLKYGYRSVTDTVSGWVAGAKESRVSKAVTNMVDALSDGDSVKEAVEVFCESIEHPETN